MMTTMDLKIRDMKTALHDKNNKKRMLLTKNKNKKAGQELSALTTKNKKE